MRSFSVYEGAVGGRPIRVVGGAVMHRGRVLAARRGPGMRLASKWEFPGGKIEPGETAEQALVRELGEELGIRVRVLDLVGESFVVSNEFRIELRVHAARWVGGVPKPVEHDAIRWCAPDELSELDWAEADVPMLGPMARRLRADRGGD
ncbi:MAG TPA: (deoxy)nucleoside triphosphate pyrophosphohydrolase [Myxococcales bacterium LLY-WYZ-16_1]|nr:(deoxy)nucleoside triphosphate pyrophosphohydrolase [Myxococcales bacterium LLY-WYZ-16_1]